MIRINKVSALFAIVAFGQLSTGVCRADYISTLLGAAGPADFALLSLGGSGADLLNINNAIVKGAGNGTVIGVVGSSGSSTFEVANPDVFTGMTVDLGTGVTITNGTLSGVGGPPTTVNTSVSFLSATTSLSSAVTTLDATQTSAGAINENWANLTTSQTIAAYNPGGVNVLNLAGNGTGIGNIKLDDSGGSQWVVNIQSTGVNITTGNISAASGSAYNIVFNVVNTNSTFQVQVPTGSGATQFSGVLVADNSSVTIDGDWNGEVIAGGGNTVTLMSAITLDHPTGAQLPTATPEPMSFVLSASGLLLLGFAYRRSKTAAVCPAKN